MFGGGVQDGYGKRFRWWLCSSFVLHAACIVALGDSLPQPSEAHASERLWLETLAPAQPLPAAAVETTTPPAPEPAQPRPRKSQPKHASVEAAAPGSGLPLAAAERGPQDGAVEVAVEVGAGFGPSHAELPVAGVRPLPAQLSLWLAPLELQRMVIVRSPRALLAALPGYRDILRGADIDPFAQLRSLRVFLPGLDAAQLTLAGEHVESEAAIVQAAERMAAARERMPSWRRSSELRAGAWLDGSSYDRALAVHGSSFLIGARLSLPGLIGEKAPAEQLKHLAKLRSGVVIAATLYDVSSYLRPLRPCQLRRLSISISAALRLHLRAQYESGETAARSMSCLAGLGESADQLRALRALLTRAAAAPGSSDSELRTGVTNEEIARLLDELAWALRRVSQA